MAGIPEVIHCPAKLPSETCLVEQRGVDGFRFRAILNELLFSQEQNQTSILIKGHIHRFCTLF